VKSQSEEDGIATLGDKDTNVLSVGISTGGEAELRMVSLMPGRRVVATTLDEEGAATVAKLIEEKGFQDAIEVRVEDISAPDLGYEPNSFDFVYARLVLHYLSAPALVVALSNIHRLLKTGGKLFVVVRSSDSPEAQQADNEYDPVTKLTTYTVAQGGRRATRYFHSEQSITDALVGADFRIISLKHFEERLSPSFNRDSDVWVPNRVIEIIAQKGEA